MTAALTVRGLNVSIGGRRVLAGVDIGLEAGRVLGVMGESGAGKSMVALAVLGLLPDAAVRSGTIALGDRRLDALDDRAMDAIRGRRVGMVFQEPAAALNPLMPVGAQVAELFRRHEGCSRTEAGARAAAVLERVGLGNIPPSRLPHQLSGGQRQRVVIAMAVALKPALLIADEATTALDSVTQLEVLALIRRLAAEDGMAVLLITHDLAVIAHMADSVVVLENGKVIDEGPVTMLRDGFNHPHAAALADAALRGTVAEAPPGRGRPLLEVGGVGFRHPGEGRGLESISFAMSEGETLGLVGASGSGKTTLSRLLLGLARPDEGRITLDGAPLPCPPRGGTVSAVFQDPYASFNPYHRVGRLVSEPFHAVRPAPTAAERRERVAAMLGKVGIDAGYMDRLIHAASGGQRQRIAFARALVTGPRLIVLDEPVSALDAPVRAKVLAAMREAAEDAGIATLFISHDLAVVRSVCPRVMVMADGRLVEDGPTERIFAGARHPASSKLVDAALDWHGALGERFGKAGPKGIAGTGGPTP